MELTNALIWLWGFGTGAFFVVCLRWYRKAMGRG